MRPKFVLLLFAVLAVCASWMCAQETTITTREITWSWEESRKTGRYANGDAWVLGPITMTSVSPETRQVGSRWLNGTMLNPGVLKWDQGFDSATYGIYAAGQYKHELNAAAHLPMTLDVDTSVVSTVSGAAGATPQITYLEVLTVVGEAPMDGAFRPGYAGPGPKSSPFTLSDVRTKRLRSLERPPSAPGAMELARMVERPWFDAGDGWMGRYLHPDANMPDYGREVGGHISNVALGVNLDYSLEEKMPAVIGLIQIGIDNYTLALLPGGDVLWTANGGHGSGRKWPILFAGIMTYPNAMGRSMALFAFDHPETHFGEDDQTFYVEETSPGVYNSGYGGYTVDDLWKADWGIRHRAEPRLDQASFGATAYRTCCTTHAWYGFVLAARIMGAQFLWNHQALFDYQDQYWVTANEIPLAGWEIAWSDWQRDAWVQHRPNH